MSRRGPEASRTGSTRRLKELFAGATRAVVDKSGDCSAVGEHGQGADGLQPWRSSAQVQPFQSESCVWPECYRHSSRVEAGSDASLAGPRVLQQTPTETQALRHYTSSQHLTEVALSSQDGADSGIGRATVRRCVRGKPTTVNVRDAIREPHRQHSARPNIKSDDKYNDDKYNDEHDIDRQAKLAECMSPMARQLLRECMQARLAGAQNKGVQVAHMIVDEDGLIGWQASSRDV